MNPGRVVFPPPRAHLAGTLAALEVVAALGGGALPPDARALLDRPEALPPQVPAEAAGLKYDLYLTAAPVPAWGVTVNDTWEPEAFGRALRHFLGPRAPVLDRFGAALGEVPATTCGLGFDRPGAAPRVKVYLKERRWGTGLTTVPELRAIAAEQLGITIPDWLGDRTLGVVSLELYADGTTGLKLYPGAASPQAAAAGAPDAAALVRRLETTSPAPGWYYLTVRLRPDAPPRVAMNKIYNVVQAAFTAGRAGPAAVWEEVTDLFAAADPADALTTLRGRLARSGLLVVPTATAVEDGGRSVDVYVGAWAADADPRGDPGPTAARRSSPRR